MTTYIAFVTSGSNCGHCFTSPDRDKAIADAVDSRDRLKRMGGAVDWRIMVGELTHELKTQLVALKPGE